MVKGTNSYTEFPINRRHQGLATSLLLALPPGRVHYLFPINRRHQGLATLLFVLFCLLLGGWFPIYGRHQGLATYDPTHIMPKRQDKFPINRRHQGLATPLTVMADQAARANGFQSIGVSKDWRSRRPISTQMGREQRFQLIGVTKDWRLFFARSARFFVALFPINRRHQGLATTRLGRGRFPLGLVSNQ